MRRLFLLPLVLLGFASALATGSNDSRSATAVKASVAGTITTLGSNAITVHSFFDVTCKLTAESPALKAFSVGERVKIACADGRLVRIAAAKKLTPPSLDPSTKSDDGAKTNSTTTATTAGAIGKLTALTSSSITVTGDRALTCTVGASSPGSGDFHVGDAVRIGCLNGALYYIVKATTTPT